MNKKIIVACGNDCSVCPRYIKEPYTKSDEEYEILKKVFFEK